MSSSDIRPATVDEIANLLGDESDPVRSEVALAIASIGPAAQRTIPVLKEALEKAKNHIFEVQNRNFTENGLDFVLGPTSADNVCFAFRQIGAESPPDCFDGHYEERPKH
jgi:hypothetical protein